MARSSRRSAVRNPNGARTAGVAARQVETPAQVEAPVSPPLLPKRIHVIAPFHTVPSAAFSWCAFTGKALRMAKMLRPYGWHVIEYANEGSESEANEKVVMLSKQEYSTYFVPETSHPGRQAQVGSPGYQLFTIRLREALMQRANRNDIVAYVFGNTHPDLFWMFPGLVHVETGIGYPSSSFGAWRIFESYAWMHYQWGRIGNPGGVMPATTWDRGLAPDRTYVVPNYYDPEDWPLVAKLADPPYVLFMNRFVVDKGIDLLARLIRTWAQRFPDHPLRFKLAGMGDYDGWLAQNHFSPSEMKIIDRLGVVTTDRAQLVGNAVASLTPSIFVEPFGGAGVEAMMTGTPVLASAFGAWTETIEHGKTGFMCRNVDDYVHGIQEAAKLDRTYIGERARRLYSLQACGAQYDRIFEELRKPGI